LKTIAGEALSSQKRDGGVFAWRAEKMNQDSNVFCRSM
jgi:hypothetical protein